MSKKQKKTTIKTDLIEVIEENIRPYGHYYVDYLSLPDRELKVLLALKSFAWYGKESCYPSLKTLGQRSGKKRSQVSEILNILQDKGLIRIKHTDGETSQYFVTNKVIDENFNNNSIRKSDKKQEPIRKSGLPPSGNPDYPHPEIRTVSNISKYKKEEREKKPTLKPISSNFKPSQKQKALANEYELDIEQEKSKFIDFYKSRGDKREKWRPEFNNWLKRSYEYNLNKTSKNIQKNFSNYVKRPPQDEVIRPKLRDITQERLDREAATGIREVTTIVS